MSDSSPEDSSHDVADAEEKVRVEEGGGVSQKGVSKLAYLIVNIGYNSSLRYVKPEGKVMCTVM